MCAFLLFAEASWISSQPLVIAVALASLAGFAAVVFFGPAFEGANVAPLGVGRLPQKPATNQKPAARNAGDRAAAKSRGDDKRSSLRRKGQPVPVLVRRTNHPDRPELGWVLDRSRGGLRLIFPRVLPPGAELAIRAENAPDGLPWVPVCVRHSEPNGKRWLVGCQFTDALPWSVLLLFG